MGDATVQGGFVGDPAAALSVTDVGGCCGHRNEGAGHGPVDSGGSASPCCGTPTEARAEGGCCGSPAKAQAVASGAGCCG